MKGNRINIFTTMKSIYNNLDEMQTRQSINYPGANITKDFGMQSPSDIHYTPRYQKETLEAAVLVSLEVALEAMGHRQILDVYSFEIPSREDF